MTPTKRVIVLSKGFPPDLGGVETYTLEIARAYRQEGFEVTVITQFQGPAGSQERDGLKVFNVGPGRQYRQLISFVNALRSVPQADLIHATTWRTALPACLLRRKEPLAVTVHGREVATLTGLMLSLCRWVLGKADRIIIISSEARKRCAINAPVLLTDKTVVAWNGIRAIGGFARPQNGVVRILTACRLTEFKNVMCVLRVAEELRATRTLPKHEFIIAGEGPQGQMLRNEAKVLGLDNVIFLGQVPLAEVDSLYRSADIFLHPQISIEHGNGFESFCLAVADAMGFGVATVAGSDGAPREYIEYGSTGYTVDGRSARDVAAIVLPLIVDPELRTAIGKRAASFARDAFKWRKHIGPSLKLIELTQQ